MEDFTLPSLLPWDFFWHIDHTIPAVPWDIFPMVFAQIQWNHGGIHWIPGLDSNGVPWDLSYLILILILSYLTYLILILSYLILLYLHAQQWGNKELHPIHKYIIVGHGPGSPFDNKREV